MTAYYVSVIDGPRRGLLLGPLNTHDGALELVPAVTRKANELDPRAAFYAFGTASIDLAPGETAPHGKLNQFFDTIGKRKEPRPMKEQYMIVTRTPLGDWTASREETAQYIGGTPAENVFDTPEEAWGVIKQLCNYDDTWASADYNVQAIADDHYHQLIER